MKATFKKRSQDDLEKFYQQNALFINSLQEPKKVQQTKIEIKQVVEPSKETEPIQKSIQSEPQVDSIKSKTERKQK